MNGLKPISTTDLRDNLAQVLEQVAIAKKSYIVSKFGKKKALIIPPSSFSDKKEIKEIKPAISFKKSLNSHDAQKMFREMKKPDEKSIS